jgi:hypothetical protein
MNRFIILTACLFSTLFLQGALFAADFNLHERLSACGCGGGGTVEKKSDELPEDKIPLK